MNAFLNTLLKIAPLFLVLFLSCKQAEEPTEPGLTPATPTSVVLSGIITDQATTQPLSGASIILQNSAGTNATTSGSSGTYLFNVDLGTTTPLNSTLTVSAAGHLTQVTNLSLAPGNAVQNVVLPRDTTTPIVPVSGFANTIAYVGPAGIKLSVYGVGGQESGIFAFEVRDSLGFPITSTRADTVSFSISGAPVAGGAYVSPSAALTSGAGRVTAVINSGTIAGTVSLIASLTRDDAVVIRSAPVKVIVHGGLPDQAHFAVGANPYNAQVYSIIGKSASTITAIVGDKYGNPVAPNTAVYFTTTQGIIGEGGFTDADGFVSVGLHSGANHSVNGFGQINARTIGENSVTVEDSIPILFTDLPIIDSVLINGGAGPLVVDAATQAVVSFRLYDFLGNPLTGGSGITVTKEGGASATFSKVAPDGTLPDTMSPFWTYFAFVVSKDVAATPAVNGTFSVTIQVTTPRGNASYTVQGTVN